MDIWPKQFVPVCLGTFYSSKITLGSISINVLVCNVTVLRKKIKIYSQHFFSFLFLTFRGDTTFNKNIIIFA
jgi:hypothetical protein